MDWSGEGAIVVVGWPGQWAATFTRDWGTGLRVTAGQELTHLTLHPGESVRSPLIVLQFWRGDWLHAQNVWRRWMLVHNLPRPGGELPKPMLSATNAQQFLKPGEQIGNEKHEIEYIDRYQDEHIPITHWWMDAGWYINHGTWSDVGTWQADPKRYPHGLRYISDYVHARGIKLIVWFEPEVVSYDSWIDEHHPEWLLGPDKADRLFNFGIPEARAWLTDYIGKILTDQGIDVYRHDYCIDPLPLWRGADAPDRQGITENHYVTGFLAYWDGLLEHHPGLLIDVADGEECGDLESLRRAVPLLRDEHCGEPVSEQCQTCGLALWVPFSGTGFEDISTYIVRSLMGPEMTLSCDARRKDLDWDLLRKLVAQWRETVPYYYGDYYPLTPYSQKPSVWMAWQFNRPESGDGMVQAFRRSESCYRSAELRLRGLDPAANYVMTDLDSKQSRQINGSELMNKGLVVKMTRSPQAVVITYHKAASP